MNRLVLIFDVDGTLVDSFPAQYKAHKDLIIKCAPHQRKKRFPAFNEGNKIMFSRGIFDPELLYRRYGIRMPKAHRWRIWREMYHNHLYSVKLIPGVYNTIEKLAEDGHCLAVISANSRDNIEPLLQKLNLNQFFTYVYTGSEHKAPKIAKILYHEGERRKKRCIFVGDMPNDIRQGRDAGVLPVAYLYHRTKEYLEPFIRAERPYETIDKIPKLLNIVEEIMEKNRSRS